MSRKPTVDERMMLERQNDFEPFSWAEAVILLALAFVAALTLLVGVR